MERKIRALFIFEILGKPPEHIKETMGELIDKLGELPGIEIDKKEIHEPKPFKEKDAKDLFTTFSEVEILSDNIENIIAVMFHAMPSHVEIIEPEELILKNFNISSMLTSLITKLHRYDEIAKAIVLERNVLANRLKEMQEKIENSKKEDKTEKKEITDEKKDSLDIKKPKKK
jgi:hypothetical protein